MPSLNIIDVLLVLVILLIALNGYRRGFILGMLDLLGWVLCLLAGLRFYQPVSRWLYPFVSETWSQPLAFVLIASITALAIQLIGSALLSRLPEDVHDRPLNQVLGLLPGAINGLIVAAILSALLLSVPFNEKVYERASESRVVNRLAVYSKQIEATLHPIFGDAIAKTLNLLTVRPESNERVELPFKVANPKPRPDLEAKMLQLVNQERVKAGLKPLAPDPELTEVARKHSTDMFARGYFAHVTPEGRDPFDRIQDAHITYLTAGENLALAPTVEVAHTGLMNSPGHRANILRPQFGRVGIGIMDGGIRGLMATQNFRD
jgi:uncharacterized protein YkwD